MAILESAPDLRTLRSTFRGAIITHGEPGWDETTQAFNTTFVQRPAFVAVPADVDDVIAIVDYARELGLQLAPQRTGHNAEPLEDMSDLILVRTDALQGVEIDVGRRVARVAAGSKWADVVPQASELGLAALHGSTPDVSVAGYSLGGGVGWYARKLGLSTNSVLAIELVTPDGVFRRVDRENEPELFWALRGGGGNFGIVTALEVQLYPIAEVYAGVLFFPWERSREVLHAWREWTLTVPDEVTSVGRILQFPPLPELPEMLRGRNFVVVEAVVIGTEEEGEALLAPLRALGAETDTFAMVPPVGIAELHMDPPTPVPYRGEGQMLGPIDAEAIDRFVDAAGPESGSPLVSAEIRHLGGALHRSAPHHGVHGTFDADYLTFAIGMVMGDGDRERVQAQIERVEAALALYDNGRQYLNFTESPTDVERFFTPEAFARLQALRAEIDPDGLMRANHPIPSAR